MNGTRNALVPLAPRHRFYSRIRNSAIASISLVGVSLAIGTVGYHRLQGVGWMTAFHKAAMILSGMGPVEPFMQESTGKLFEAVYALYSGVVLLAATAVLVAPVFHRLLHRFHLEDSGG